MKLAKLIQKTVTRYIKKETISPKAISYVTYERITYSLWGLTLWFKDVKVAW
jgi:hypothetical protein